MAEIGWIDFSPAHRERVGAVLDLLTPEGVVDELGIGSIRDALADEMFPGISTIQTRAKYFFFIPYILHDYMLLSAPQKRTNPPGKYLEKQENEIMWNLAKQFNYDRNSNSGVIGITKHRPEKIMRRASAIYWNGLSVFGFIRHGGLGVDSFLRSRVNFSESLLSKTSVGDDEARDDADADYENLFNLRIPYDKFWLDDLTLELTSDEADLLSHRMREAGRKKLLEALLEQNNLYKLFEVKRSFSDFARAAIHDPQINSYVRNMLILAHDFSELMYGAHIAYNWLLQKKKFNNNAYDDEWNEWIKKLSNQMIGYKQFNPENIFFYTLNTRDHTRAFINSWWNLVTGAPHLLKKRNELIEIQEYNTKHTKARLRQGKYDDVKNIKWTGLKRLEYRMPQAKRILKDIAEGMKRK